MFVYTTDSTVVQVEGSSNLPLKLAPASEVPQLLRAEVYISGPPPGVYTTYYAQISYSCL